MMARGRSKHNGTASQESGRRAALDTAWCGIDGPKPVTGREQQRAMAQAEWADLFTNDLAVVDPEIAELIAAQERQNRAIINLVASETYCPAAALAAETPNWSTRMPAATCRLLGGVFLRERQNPLHRPGHDHQP